MNNPQIYDQSGEMIASYNWASGWTSVPTSAENAGYHMLTFAYYDAYCNAREAMKAGNISNVTAVLEHYLILKPK
ncbi:hypothetical protein [Clostridium ljungdahlii]|uniref:Uncharacterized protein n=1 Tax=Clostridium ljungdahlii TaxID=1538 RepID=A0A168MKI7_9CLOT|nr:hypothetical protein [Clostridium ljungdahlii]OAA84817.1 hypothetical protein WY13_02720 [Clostridium ljungdahlii]